MMGSLQYSRTYETEADVKGFHMLQAAHLDPAAMIAFYEIMQNNAAVHAGPPDFLSSHPDMAERLARLISLAGPPPANRVTLLPGEDWQDIRTLCRLRADSRPEPVSLDGL
jgi:predicted Zn-dependent protease